MPSLVPSLLFALACALTGVHGVWPPPRFHTSAGDSLSLCYGFEITHEPVPSSLSSSSSSLPFLPAHTLLQLGIARTLQHLKALQVRQQSSACLPSVHITIASSDTTLDLQTAYDYALSIAPLSSSSAVPSFGARINSTSAYGALYGLETLLQLVQGDELRAHVELRDAPDHAWRGLMLDSGRRFFPVPLLKNLLDTMAAVKLNVLHLHVSDQCRFGVQSKLYPNLTDALQGVLGGFYTAADIADVVAYAAQRGIRVMPEFDLPGHTHGYIPAESAGAVFCTHDATRSQLYGDPGNRTYTLLHALLKEMSALFPDPVMHLGCDETSVVGPCTLQSTFALERAVIQAVAGELGKTPAGWEEIYFNAGAATQDTIVFTWSRHHPPEVTATGRKVVENAGPHFYFTEPGAAGPAGWAPCWYDIDTGVPAAQQALVLGGEMSMWTDTYCYIDQCGSSQGSKPVGAALFPPERDDAFGRSVAGMIWPRGFVGAAAFWQYNSSVDPASPAFVAAINNLTQQLQARGQLVCPAGCYCDQLSACGVPYLQPSPVVGAAVGLQACQAGVTLATQRWSFSGGRLALAVNQSLCLQLQGNDQYPAHVAPCDAGTTLAHTAQAQFVAQYNQQCLDAREADGAVGVWECGANQPNQMWAFDNATGLVASLGSYPPGVQELRGRGGDFGGQCLTVLAA